MSESLRPWPKLSTRRGESMVLFRPRWDTLRNPRTNEVMERLVLETPDWVNVVAFTDEGKLVCVRQFRFGTGVITLEIPGGALDPREPHEAAARRELREETGYTAERWSYLGSVEPNPAFQDNLCHHWLAEGARHTHDLELDSGEDIEVAELSLEEVRAAVARGEIRHSLVLTALARVLDLRNGSPGSR
ncbi:MAG TPA: NUDIX hydrolase [Planctomycetota bacterium]|nr:NUDIX hydrolase [Planctomycetota bacterium]